jgi:Cdc6-like AAA superfamily ATPase
MTRTGASKRSKKMENLPTFKRQLNSWNGNAQMVKARESAGPVLPATTSVEPGLVSLDATVTGTKAKDLETKLHRAGLSPESRPIGNFLFLGPTGTGKTRAVEATAEALVGNPRAIIKIDCGEFQHSHQIAKLIGSPPGYLGHRETHPMLAQDVLNQHHTDTVKDKFRAVR